MKNKFFKLNLLQLKSLSKLGLNVKQVYYSKTTKNKNLRFRRCNKRNRETKAKYNSKRQ